MKTNAIWLVYSTFPNREEALSVARALVGQRLAACANIYGSVTSVYCWQGAIRQEDEVVLTAKTSAKKLPAAINAIRSRHSYALPCITAYPITDGLPEFLRWVADETA